MTRLATALAFALAGTALADIPPPDISGCASKAAGDACQRDDGSAGVCTKDTCSRNDYSQGPPPQQVDFECLRCVPGAPPAPPEPKKSACASLPAEGVASLLALLLLRRRR
jgi:hypothetical protein